jgi:hypothetical protein
MRPELKRDILFATVVSIIMSSVMAFFMPLFGMGWQPNFFRIWYEGFFVGLVISFPMTLLVIPYVYRKISVAVLE